MHELLLFGAVPEEQHRHVLSVLAGVTAMQPMPLLEQHLIYKPTRKGGTAPQAVAGKLNPSGRPGAGAGGVDGGPGLPSSDLFYVQLVGDLSTQRSQNKAATNGIGLPGLGEAAKFEDGDVEMPDAADIADNQGNVENGADNGSISWTWEFRDLPDVPGKRPATSRLMASIPISQGDPRAFMEAMGFFQAGSYYMTGHSFTHNSIALRLFETLQSSSNNTTVGAAEDLAKLLPLDRSGAYLLQASLRVQDGSRPELMGRGFSELTDLKKTLQGVVEIGPAERLSLDPRVR